MDHSQCFATWDDSNKIIKFNTVWAKGLTKILFSTFYPHFSVKKVLKRTKNQTPRAKGGRKLGVKIDKLLHLFVKTGKQPPAQEPSSSYFICVQKALKDHFLVPIDSQVAVGCVYMRIATKIDILCKNSKNQFCIIELKCGYDSYWNTFTKEKFVEPFQNVQMTCENQSYLQLLFTTYFYIHNKLPSEEYGTSYLLHVFRDSDGVVKYDMKIMPDYFDLKNDSFKQAVSILESRKHQTRKRKRQG